MRSINPRNVTALQLRGDVRQTLARGTLLQRFGLAKMLLKPCESQYRIVWENPREFDDPASITTPDPNWLACALFGYILPPVEVHLMLKRDAAQPGFENHHRRHFLDTAPTLEPMTEEQAIEYLVKKDLPNHIWDGSYQGNRQILRIVKASSIPANRTFRDAWRVNQEQTA
ncbi:MAG: hypothetical protein JJ866_16755 [Roseibium sp.]|uniref:hypothetical protein n=1 Tax=Roseibium sp. TaxID=1936156 RepID=UPI001B015E90|nr:hypothetical protein [Roseibium sp.]MBO6893594.1 hypothetical protein [Roseibium sp.]MBO6930250.1 hypothetical protein [Roseibium sp.]